MRFRIVLISASLFVVFGCARVPYEYSPLAVDARSLALKEGEPQVERGEPYAVIDFVGKYQPFALLSKLILWSWSIENHDIGAETEEALKHYLEANHLDRVKVRINQYSPGNEWGRLFDNTAVGAGWRYTLGAFTVLIDTVFPGRIFGGDSYNPYTNTISLYSDHPAVALHEAGHANYFAPLESKGSYAALYALPFVSLYFEAKATGDALGYLECRHEIEAEKSAYKVLYPAYGTYIGGEFVRVLSIWTGVSELWALPVVIAGHAVGRIKAARLGDELADDKQHQSEEVKTPACAKVENEGETTVVDGSEPQ